MDGASSDAAGLESDSRTPVGEQSESISTGRQVSVVDHGKHLWPVSEIGGSRIQKQFGYCALVDTLDQ